MRPLDGIRVIALEQAVAVPFATRHLADLGAEIIKVERTDGGDFARQYDASIRGGLATHFAWLNRGKQSIALNLADPAGKAVLSDLLEGADVFLHNLGPGAVDRLGFDAETVRARTPGLIVAELTGYGKQGPMSERKAYDLLVQAEAGFVSITGSPLESWRATRGSSVRERTCRSRAASSDSRPTTSPRLIWRSQSSSSWKA